MARRDPKLVVKKAEWNRIKRVMMAADTNESRTGWFEGQTYGPENDFLPIAQVASWQEEGTTGGQKNGRGIPSRPFIRTLFKGLKRNFAFQGMMRKNLKAVLDGQMTWNSFYGHSGRFIKQRLKDTIKKWTLPRNAPATIANKGFNDPLVETGTMWKSIRTKVFRRGKKRGSK